MSSKNPHNKVFVSRMMPLGGGRHLGRRQGLGEGAVVTEVCPWKITSSALLNFHELCYKSLYLGWPMLSLLPGLPCDLPQGRCSTICHMAFARTCIMFYGFQSLTLQAKCNIFFISTSSMCQGFHYSNEKRMDTVSLTWSRSPWRSKGMPYPLKRA